MKNRLLNIPFQYKIFWGSLLIALLPLIFFTTVVIHSVSSVMIQESREAMNQQMVQAYDTIDTMLKGYQTASNALAQNAVIKDIMLERGSDALKKDVFIELYQQQTTLNGATGFSIYDAGGLIRFSVNTEVFPEYIPHEITKISNPSNETEHVNFQFLSDEETSRYLSIQSIFSDSGIKVGYVLGILYPEDFAHGLSNVYDDDTTIMLLDGDDKILYQSSDQNHIAMDIISSAHREISMQIDDLLYASEYYVPNDLTLFLVADISLLHNTFQTLRTISYSFAILCFILCVFLSLALSRSLIKPFYYINRAMIRIMGGDLDTRIQVCSNDEIGQLSTTFNAMAEELKIYTQNQINHQKDINRLQMQHLQEQLNPHFLYNTFDTVKWLAKINHIPQISKIVTSLGVLLRSSIDSRLFITLQQEIALLEKYIDIQSIRFEGKFEWCIDIQPNLYDTIVPKMILQPIVENAILHGLNDFEDGFISIYAREDGENLNIYVTDDGCGMTATELLLLERYMSERGENHLGLYNVNHMIKLHWGDEYGLFVKPLSEVGTTVQIKIPMNKEMSDD